MRLLDIALYDEISSFLHHIKMVEEGVRERGYASTFLGLVSSNLRLINRRTGTVYKPFNRWQVSLRSSTEKLRRKSGRNRRGDEAKGTRTMMDEHERRA